jgi:hypothetical protein
VSELLAARASGQLADGPILLQGYWSNALVGHSCAAPDGQTGELEIYCHDGEFGITELDEPIIVVSRGGSVTPASGPSITPWLPGTLFQATLVAPVNGQSFPPVPIVASGHFDDPRAADCRPVARQLCKDRFVIDEIVQFDVAAVPTPGVSPSPSPFPFDAPPKALFDSDQCQPGTAAAPAFEFVGWKDGGELDLSSGRDLSGEVLYVAISKDVVPLGDWFTLPGDTRESRPMGRLVCLAHEWEEVGGVEFDSLAGSGYRLYRDGSTAKPAG